MLTFQVLVWWSQVERTAGRLLLLALAGGPLALAAEPAWPCYRGPNHDGVSTEKGWSVQWPAEGPKQLWKVQAGMGYSSMSVSGGRVYTMGNTAGTDAVTCLDAVTGKEIWKHTYACPSPPLKDYPGPRATPAVDGDKVYTLSRKGHVFCLDAAKGTVVWQKNAIQEVRAQAPQWDFAGSVLVHGNLAILNVGSAGLGLDKATGKVVWKSGPGVSGYATPVPFDLAGQKGVAIFAAKELLAVDPADGKVLWNYPWETRFDVNSADPVFLGDKVFFSSGYGRGCTVLQASKGPPAKVWENKELSTHISGSVGWNGCVYGCDGQAGQGALKCLDVQTGAVKWAQAGKAGFLLISDGKLILLSYSGRLSVAEASPQGFKELAGAQVLGGQCWTVPVLCGGRIYCRNTAGDLICLDLK